MMEEACVEVRVPGDKSITHRALILAALARGTSELRGLLPAEDPNTTARVLRALGCAIPELPRNGAAVRVAGRGLDGLREPADTLDCGNSGTTARLVLGVLAGFPFAASLTGDESLRSRPMRRVTEPLARMGACIEELGEPDRLPVRVRGGVLRPLDYDSPKASAQVKSALLLAGLTGGVRVSVAEPVRSRDHTERLLRAMGAHVILTQQPRGGASVRLEPPRFLEPLELTVPGDFSSAAFFIALGLLAPAGGIRIPGVGVNPTRTGLLEVLRRMGAEPAVDAPRGVGSEAVGVILARPAPLRATEVSDAEIPMLIDEVPVLAALASRAEGETRITGARELRVKESDRLAALAANLRAIGVEAEELPDGLVVRGTERPLRGRVRSFGDHRIAMAFGVLGALPENEIEVEGADVVSISYPGFWEELRRCAAALMP
ncbi:MAG: 3-phosphoshikimate 1-carboxyvinyltransferase [Gemmatimonadetes bacterium]|nr:3-phosphoshikimate 1-carboxyvinyltransferase [Gemmatimonadota bacterium]